MNFAGSTYRFALVAEVGRILMRASATSIDVQTDPFLPSPVARVVLRTNSIAFVPSVAHLSAWIEDGSTGGAVRVAKLSPGMAVLFTVVVPDAARIESAEIGYLTDVKHPDSLTELTIVSDLVYMPHIVQTNDTPPPDGINDW